MHNIAAIFSSIININILYLYLAQKIIYIISIFNQTNYSCQQGYPGELLGPVVRGVPSMHIAIGLNWIPELLQLPDLEKQLFAIELTSHLALQNAMPSTLSISRLGINTLATLMSGW